MYTEKLADIASALNIMVSQGAVVDKYFDYFNLAAVPNTYILRAGIIGTNGVKYPPNIKVGSRCVVFSDSLMSRPNQTGAEFIVEFRRDYDTHQSVYRYQTEEIGKMLNEMIAFLLSGTLPAIPV